MNNRLNIFCINHEYPPVGGGAATVTRELLLRLYERNHHIVLLTEKIPDSSQHGEEAAFPVFRVNAWRKSVSQGSYIEFMCFFFKSLKLLRKIHMKFLPDVTFAFFTIPGGLLALIQKWLYGTPYVVSIRGGDIPGFIIDKKLAFFHFLSAPLITLICKRASLVHTNSERLRDLANKIMPHIPIKVIPNGVVFDDSVIPDEELSDTFTSQKESCFKILFVGRLSRQKNLHTFLIGLAKLPGYIKENISFSIVGEGPERKKLEQVVKEVKLGDKVHFLNWMERNDVRNIYKTHTISVIPSLDEGMPNSALESIASGCPVLASRFGALSWTDECLKNHWIVKNELDGVEWKDKILNLYQRKEKIPDDFRLMYAYAKNRYCWKRLIDEYEKLLVNLKS